jgi:serine/threonine protein kinase
MHIDYSLKESFNNHAPASVFFGSMSNILSHKDLIGCTISHFKILEKIGEGGMGYVYRALDQKLCRDVALKILPPCLCHLEAQKKRFLQEARLLSSLDHPFICTIHDIFENEDGILFMVMPYYKGKTLREQMKNGKLSTKEASNLIMQIGTGLSKAHEHSIIHQDIKPENIVITEDHIPKIVDFGVARLLHSDEAEQKRKTMGTDGYMSPEQILGAEVDHRTDEWSLGVVFYELLSGYLPFRGYYEETVVYSILNEEPEPIPRVPAGLRDIIFKCLAKKAEDRYQNMLDFLTDLEVYQTRQKFLAERSLRLRGKS